jgi:phenylacetate-coenzyme A ligase PaaK-like adenylate-forming protein
MTFIHINRMLQQFGCMNFPFSNHTAVDFIHTATKLYGINCFAGITSVVLAALRGMAPLGMDGIKINKVFYGGEHIYEADKIELQEKYGVQVIGAPGYGTVDTWYIGYQCLSSETGTFHTHDDQCYVEIFDEESNQHVTGEGIGMLYATPMVRRLTPIVRYRVGDRAQWVQTPCQCGRQTPRFKLLGRGDDVLRIGYDSVDYNFIQSVVITFKELTGTVQMQKKRVEGRDQLIILIEAADFKNADLPKHVAEKITNLRPTLRDHVKKETVWPVQVVLMEPGKIERNVRTGKLIRVKDSIQEKNG